jgi:tetratricopeptide (TPR) repeat protein
MHLSYITTDGQNEPTLCHGQQARSLTLALKEYAVPLYPDSFIALPPRHLFDNLIQGDTLSARTTVMQLPARFLAIALRTIIACVCGLGIWCSWNLARADYLFRQDTAESIRSAIRLAPDNSEYFMRLALLDEEHDRELLETALRLNQYNAQAAVELGLRYEADGDYSRAETLLLHAFSVDHTYFPRWSLANFYLRRGDMPAFWTWTRRAAEMPAGDIGALFELCWRVSPNPEEIAGAILNDNPELTRQYLVFLRGKDQLHSAGVIGLRLIRTGAPETDRPLLLAVVNQLLAANDLSTANALWRELIQQHWVVADTRLPNNANFAHDPLPVSFDWSLASYPGLHSWPGPSGLETEFTGEQPENCSIAEQTLVLTPGTYALEYSYHTTDIPPDTGVQWQIIDAKSGVVLAHSPDLSSTTLKHSMFAFSVSPEAPALRLRLTYQRALGTPRISGTLVMLSTEIEARPQT